MKNEKICTEKTKGTLELLTLGMLSKKVATVLITSGVIVGVFLGIETLWGVLWSSIL